MPGALDSEGVYLYAEDDLAAPGVGFSEMLNTAPESISTQLGLIRADIADLGGAVPTSIDDLSDVDTTTDVPSIGDTLNWDGTNWVPGAGGGASSFTAKLDIVPAYYATTAYSSVPTFGGWIECTTDSRITAVRIKANTVAGATYRLTVAEINPATKTILTIMGTQDVASPGTVTGAILEATALALDIDAGKSYALLMHDVGGGNVTGYNLSSVSVASSCLFAHALDYEQQTLITFGGTPAVSTVLVPISAAPAVGLTITTR